MGIFTLPRHIDPLSLIHNVNYILQELLPCPYLRCLLLEFVCTCGDCMAPLSLTGPCPLHSSIIETWSPLASSRSWHLIRGRNSVLFQRVGLGYIIELTFPSFFHRQIDLHMFAYFYFFSVWSFSFSAHHLQSTFILFKVLCIHDLPWNSNPQGITP